MWTRPDCPRDVRPTQSFGPNRSDPTCHDSWVRGVCVLAISPVRKAVCGVQLCFHSWVLSPVLPTSFSTQPLGTQLPWRGAVRGSWSCTVRGSALLVPDPHYAHRQTPPARAWERTDPPLLTLCDVGLATGQTQRRSTAHTGAGAVRCNFRPVPMAHRRPIACEPRGCCASHHHPPCDSGHTAAGSHCGPSPTVTIWACGRMWIRL